MASHNTAVIEAKSNYRIALVSLMQMMNMSINDDFDIQQPDIEKIINQQINTNSELVYNAALSLQPNIQSAKLNIQSAELGVKIAKSAA